MRLLDWFRDATALRARPSAEAAKERLQLLLAIERSGGGPVGAPSFLPKLQRDILEAIKKYIEIDDDKVSVEIERGQSVSMLEVNIELPAGAMEAKGLRGRAGAVAAPGAA